MILDLDRWPPSRLGVPGVVGVAGCFNPSLALGGWLRVVSVNGDKGITSIITHTRSLIYPPRFPLLIPYVVQFALDSIRSPELSTLSHSHLYNHEQQSLRFVEHPYNFNIANKTIKIARLTDNFGFNWLPSACVINLLPDYCHVHKFITKHPAHKKQMITI